MSETTRQLRLRALAGLAAGLVFGAGLAIAQMTDPLKVLGFLDVAGAWDASLLFVLGGAAALATIGYQFVLRHRARPLFDERFHLPTLARIDPPLLVGATLFGIGWGLTGYCPGPALASIGQNNPEAWWLVPALLAGTALRYWQSRAPGASRPARA